MVSLREACILARHQLNMVAVILVQILDHDDPTSVQIMYITRFRASIDSLREAAFDPLTLRLRILDLEAVIAHAEFLAQTKQVPDTNKAHLHYCVQRMRVAVAEIRRHPIPSAPPASWNPFPSCSIQ